MKKIVLHILFYILGFIVLVAIYIRNLPDLKNAPKLYYRDSLYLYVKKISYERNNLYLNGTLYDAGGITGFSVVNINDTKSIDLWYIKPPFKIEKFANNDTLKIIKNDEQYYLLVTKEQEWLKNKPH